MWNLNKTNRNRLVDTENKVIVARGKGMEGWVKTVKRNKMYKPPVKEKCHGYVMYSIGKIVVIIITLVTDGY